MTETRTTDHDKAADLILSSENNIHKLQEVIAKLEKDRNQVFRDAVHVAAVRLSLSSPTFYAVYPDKKTVVAKVCNDLYAIAFKENKEHALQAYKKFVSDPI